MTASDRIRAARETAELRALHHVEARDQLEDSSLEDLTAARRAASRRFQTAKEIHGRRSVHAIAARAAHNRISTEIQRRRNIDEAAPAAIAERLEQLRAELRAERISYGELAELADLAEHIEPGDVELLEAAGIPEFPELNRRTPAGRMAATIAADATVRRFYDTAPGPRCSPAAVAAIARAVDRDYGETGYVLTIVGDNAAGAIARVEHFDGSRFLLVADRFENVERVPDLEPAELADDDEPAGAGTDPRPDPRTHPEAWTE